MVTKQKMKKSMLNYTGICCDNDADSYGGPDILPPGISVDMFNEEYFI